MLNKIISWTKGKKTYFTALGVAIVAVATYMGWIDIATASALYGLLGAGGIASLRSAVKDSK